MLILISPMLMLVNQKPKHLHIDQIDSISPSMMCRVDICSLCTTSPDIGTNKITTDTRQCEFYFRALWHTPAISFLFFFISIFIFIFYGTQLRYLFTICLKLTARLSYNSISLLGRLWCDQHRRSNVIVFMGTEDTKQCFHIWTSKN